MVACNKFHQLSRDLARAAHNFESHSFKMLLSSDLPSNSADKIKADVTEIAAGNGYTAGGIPLTITVTSTNGVTRIIVAADVSLAASGGSISFRYAVIYNDTQSSPVKPLVCWYDHGSTIVISDGNSLPFNFDQVNGIISIAL